MKDKGEEEELDEVAKKSYQSLAARLNYLALGRTDVQYGVKELMRAMSKPMLDDWEKLKRMTRYLLGAPRACQVFRWQRRPEELKVYVDSDFAGCHRNRKSTSGGVIMWGSHMIKSWSKTQPVIALSSGEAELGALVKGSTEALGMVSVLGDFGQTAGLELHSDASAAIGMVKREGLGKVRHLAVADLWIQQKEADRSIKYFKVDGKANVADILTKGVEEALIKAHMHSIGFEFKFGRHRFAPNKVD